MITPTFLIFTSGGDPDIILASAGRYLLGFTYLYVGWNLLGGLDGTGLGWFSAFVAVCAAVYAGLDFGRFDDPAFGVIRLYWAVLWTLFFLVLRLKRDGLTRFTGAVAGVATAAVPAFMLLTGVWDGNVTTSVIALAVIRLLSLGPCPRLREPRASAATAPAPELRWGQTVEQVGRTPARTDGDEAADVEQSGRRPSDAPADRRR